LWNRDEFRKVPTEGRRGEDFGRNEAEMAGSWER